MLSHSTGGKIFLGLALTVAVLALAWELVLEATDYHSPEYQNGYLSSVLRIQKQGKDDHLTINIGPASLQSYLKVTALASHTSPACENIKFLEIRSMIADPVGPTGRLLSSILNTTSEIPKALACLKNVQRVSWDIDREPAWLSDSIMETIASFPSLSEFSINYLPQTDSFPPLHLLRNLTKLSVQGRCDNYREKVVPAIAQVIANSPDLKHLDVASGQWWGDERVPRLHDLFVDIPTNSLPLKLQHLGIKDFRLRLDDITIPHLRSLTSFEWMRPTIIKNDSYATPIGEVWQILKKEGAHLSRLQTELMDDDLLDFLSSYRGLIKLQLHRVTGKDSEDSDRLAKVFFQDVLPHHAESLESLGVIAGFEGDWCFGEYNMASILNCTNLVELDTSVYWPQKDRSKGAPVHQILNSSKFQLRRLGLLRIHAASPPNLRDSWCGNPLIEHHGIVNAAILKAVNNFDDQITDGDISHVPVPEVRTAGRVFRFRVRGRKYHDINVADERYP